MLLNYQFRPKFSTGFIFSVVWFVKADSAIIIIRMDNSALGLAAGSKSDT